MEVDPVNFSSPLRSFDEETKSLGILNTPADKYEVILLSSYERTCINLYPKNRLPEAAFVKALHRMNLLAYAFLMTNEDKYLEDIDFLYERIYYQRENSDKAAFIFTTAYKVSNLKRRNKYKSNWKKTYVKIVTLVTLDNVNLYDFFLTHNDFDAKNDALRTRYRVNALQSDDLADAFKKYNLTKLLNRNYQRRQEKINQDETYGTITERSDTTSSDCTPRSGQEEKNSSTNKEGKPCKKGSPNLKRLSIIRPSKQSGSLASLSPCTDPYRYEVRKCKQEGFFNEKVVRFSESNKSNDSIEMA